MSSITLPGGLFLAGESTTRKVMLEYGNNKLTITTTIVLNLSTVDHKIEDPDQVMPDQPGYVNFKLGKNISKGVPSIAFTSESDTVHYLQPTTVKLAGIKKDHSSFKFQDSIKKGVKKPKKEA